MRLCTGKGYINWYTKHMQMATKMEHKVFKVENWSEEAVEKLFQTRLLDFLRKFNGHNDRITQEFIENFENGQTKVGELSIPVNSTFISQALEVPLIGEKYHKGLHFKGKGWTFFLEKQRKGTFDGTKGILREWFREPWLELVVIIQKYFTCDNRHSIVYLYHIKLLQHIKGDCKINIPYFFSKSLTKMIEIVKNKTEAKEANIYHCGLIKILVEYQVRNKEILWNEFLTKNHFEYQLTGNEERLEQLHVTKSIMNSPLYPGIRLKKKQDGIMIEKEKSFLTIPRRSRRKSQEDPNNQGKDPEVEIVETKPPQK